MKLKKYTKEELEIMGYDDIAVLVLEQHGKKMKIADIFKSVCESLELDDSEYVNKIGDFFELLSTNKKFISLENGFWDLKSKHNNKVIIDEEDDDLIDSPEEMPELKEEEEEDIFYESDDNEDEEDDDLKDLLIIDEDEDEANIM